MDVNETHFADIHGHRSEDSGGHDGMTADSPRHSDKKAPPGCANNLVARLNPAKGSERTVTHMIAQKHPAARDQFPIGHKIARVVLASAVLVAVALPFVPVGASDDHAAHLYLPTVISAGATVNGNGGSGITPIK